MPIFDYRCRQCANEFELLVLKHSPVPACPKCESQDIEQLLSGFAVSSEAMTKERVKAARHQSLTSKGARDEKVAQQEYYKKEHEEHRQS
jgi:putative FmdB family regulatory protein